MACAVQLCAHTVQQQCSEVKFAGSQKFAPIWLTKTWATQARLLEPSQTRSGAGPVGPAFESHLFFQLINEPVNILLCP